MQFSNDDLVLHKLCRDLISGSHILHYNNVLDAFGHISFRHPHKPHIFVMPRNTAPGTISSVNDLIEYFVDDAQPVDPNAPKGFLERCIHSECYKKYSSVDSVIHSHSEAVVPYSFSGVSLRAVYHMGGFLGTHVPVWDIMSSYLPGDVKDLLVRNVHLGKSLAESFGGNLETDHKAEYACSVVLMRGHGFTVLAESIQDCVMRAVYTQKNAMIQSTAMTTRAAESTPIGPIRDLNEEEIVATTQAARIAADRCWGLWLREVEACTFYRNSA